MNQTQHGTCQLFCGEMASTVIAGVHIGPKCFALIMDIAASAGVVIDQRGMHYRPRLVKKLARAPKKVAKKKLETLLFPVVVRRRRR